MYSNYDYFTPSQVEYLCQQVCVSQKLLTKFDLVRDSLGVYGVLTIFDCESEDKLEYVMATEVPAIKATNISQQYGGCVTFTERYLKQSAFGITDNNLDFDTQKQDDHNYIDEWKIALKGCKSLLDLNTLYTQNQEAVKDPEVKKLFTERKKQIEDGKK